MCGRFTLHTPESELDQVFGPQLWPMLDQYPADEMTAYPVSSLVGSVRNDSPELIAPSE